MAEIEKMKEEYLKKNANLSPEEKAAELAEFDNE